MTLRIQFASGQSQCCPPTVAPIAGNLSAGTYYFFLSLRNDVGYNLMSIPSPITIGANQGIRITIPAAATPPGTNWQQVAVSVSNTPNGTESKVLLSLNLRDNAQNYIALPFSLDITRSAHIATEQSTNVLPSGADLINGMIRTYTPNGFNYRYIASSLAVADGTEVISAATGRWHRFYDGYNVYVAETEQGCDKPLQLISDTDHILNLEYALDGSQGAYREYWLYNKGNVPIGAGKRVGLVVSNVGEDVTASYVGLLKTIFKGYFDRTDNSWIVSGFNYVNVVEPFSLDQNNLVLEQPLGENQAFILRVYPEFNVSQISASDVVPAYNSELTIIPFIYANQGKATDLGAFLGNCILSSDPGFRRIYPAPGLTGFVDSGSGIVNNYFWRNIAASSLLNLNSNQANQIVVVNTNGIVYPTSSPLGINEAKRAIVSTQAGQSEVSSYTSSMQGDTNPNLVVKVDYPTTIRQDYGDVIKGSSKGQFNAEEIVFYVARLDYAGGNVLETRRFSGNLPTNTTSDTFTLSYNTGVVITNGSEPTTPFGLYAPPTPTLQSVTNTSGDYFYKVAVAFKYNGGTITSISHDPLNGCIPELYESLSEISLSSRYYREPVANNTALSNLASTELINGGVYISLNDTSNNISIYVYDLNETGTPDGQNILSSTGTGKFVRIRGLDGKTILSGTNVPAPSLGNIGDLYLRTTNNTLYGPKTGSGWGSGVSLVGSAGATGPQGPQGPQGQAGTSSGLPFLFEASTSAGAPSGKLRLNNGIGTATAVYISEQDSDSIPVHQILDNLNPDSVITLTDSSNPQNRAYYRVASALVDNGTYRTIPVVYLGHNGNFADGTKLYLNFSMKGLPGLTAGVNMVFDTATTSNPSSGKVRYNASTPSSTTSLFVSETDAYNLSIVELLNTLTLNSIVMVTSFVNPANRAYFKISGNVVDDGASRTIPVNYLSHTGSFVNDEQIILDFTIKGDSGASGTVSSTSGLVLTEQAGIGTTNADEIVLANVNNALAWRAESNGQTYTVANLEADTNTITYSATVNLDMRSLTGKVRTISLAGDLTLTASNQGAGLNTSLRLIADNNTRSLTFPSGWKFMGTKPANIAANKTGMLSILYFGNADSDCIAAWSVEQ